MYDHIVLWVYRNKLDTLKAFEYVNLEYYFWKFITVVYDRADVNKEMLKLPNEVFYNLVGVMMFTILRVVEYTALSHWPGQVKASRK